MRSVAGEAFFVVDSHKLGREALFRVFGFEAFAAGITDATLDPIPAARFPVPIIRAPVTTPRGTSSARSYQLDDRRRLRR